MPRQQRLGRDDRGDLLQNFATQLLGFRSKAAPLVIGKAKSVSADLRSQNPIFFDDIFDHLLLSPVQPTGNRNDEKRKRI